jgi:hypothetical protein
MVWSRLAYRVVSRTAPRFARASDGRVAAVKFGGSISGPGLCRLPMVTLTQPSRNLAATWARLPQEVPLSGDAPLSARRAAPAPRPRRPAPVPPRAVPSAPRRPAPHLSRDTRGASTCDIHDMFGTASCSRYSWGGSNRRIRVGFGRHERRICRVYSWGEYGEGRRSRRSSSTSSLPADFLRNASIRDH